MTRAIKRVTVDFADGGQLVLPEDAANEWADGMAGDVISLRNRLARYEPAGEAVVFTVPGKPQPKERARTVRNRKTGKVQTFTPEKTRAYEKRVGECFRKATKQAPFEGRVGVELDVFFQNARRQDIDNVLKSVADGLKGSAYADDSQIDLTIVRRHIDRLVPRVEVRVWPLSGMPAKSPETARPAAPRKFSDPSPSEISTAHKPAQAAGRPDFTIKRKPSPEAA